ncbi:hypothetical protein GCM10029964_091470 [Kibdelosporangium lantanae]
MWLNEAQRYLRDPSANVRTDIATTLLEVLADDSRGPVLVLGTLWPEQWHELTRTPDEGKGDLLAAARRLLTGHHVRVPDTFTNAEVAMARRSADQVLVAAASRATGTAVTQQLAGVPDLLQRYETAGMASRAVVHAMMDARRFGHPEWFPEDFLRAAARCYLTGPDHHNAEEDSSWFEAGIGDLLLSGTASGPALHRTLLGYRLDDFLDQEGRLRRRFEFPPAAFWTTVVESDMPADTRIQMADGAAQRFRLRIAASLYEVTGTTAAGQRLDSLARHFTYKDCPDTAERLVQHAVEMGVPEALMSLARLRHAHRKEGVVPLLRQAVELGQDAAFDLLAHLLEQSGDHEEAESVARRAIGRGSWEAIVSVAEWRDIDSPDEAERLILDLPEEVRWVALAEFVCRRDGVDDHDGAERLAVAAAVDGHPEVLLMLADNREGSGDKAAARRLLARMPRPQTCEDALRLALSCAQAGAHDEARTLLAQISGALDLNDQIAVIVDGWPHLLEPLYNVLAALQERLAIQRLTDRLSRRQSPAPALNDDEDLSPNDEEMDEIAGAYVVLAGFHARRGEFEQAESLATAASELGDANGLVILGHELLHRGDRVYAERLALQVVNMSATELLTTLGGEPSNMLAEARADDALLVWGLEADGSTAKPW